MKPFSLIVCQAALFLVLSACSIGPDYKRPNLADIMPTDWHWKLAEPMDQSPKGEWWNVFDDPILQELETCALANNQSLRGAVARVDEARAAARLTRGQFFPELSLDPGFRRERTSGHLPTPIPFKIPSAQLNTFSVPLDLSYEVDLWGRVRRSFESAQAQAQASFADYQNVLLTLTADLAVNYFLLRAFDVEISAIQRTLELANESVRVLNERFATGVIPEIDLAQAKAELASVKADLADAKRQRAETLHALALLCGKAASSFVIAENSRTVLPAAVPAGLPSSLLERRPDIARAERNMAAKNAQIGVARAAYFPALRLTGQAGYLSAEADTLFSADSRVWSIGPGISFPIFTGGRTSAQVKEAQAAYEEAVANYRQTVLTAFKEVEDSLADISLRDQQAEAQAEALTSARRVTALAKARYDAGTTSYLELLDAERNLLQQERKDAQLQGFRFAASVRLIKALGGGWKAPP